MISNFNKEREFYNSSILIDIYKYPENDEKLKDCIESVVNDIYPETGFAKSGEEYKKYRRHLKQIFLNLVVSIIKSRPIATSRNRNNFSTDTRYSKIHFSYTHITRSLDRLEQLGYLEQKKGVRFSFYKKVTRFWSTEKFFELVKKVISKPPAKEIDGEIIRLRAKKNNKNDKKLASYSDSDNPSIPQMRKDLELINSVNDKAEIQLDINENVVSYSLLDYIQCYNNIENMLKVKSSKISFKVMKGITDNIHENLHVEDSRFNYKLGYYNLHKTGRRNKVYEFYNVIPIDVKLTKFDDSPVISSKINRIAEQIIKGNDFKDRSDYFYADNLSVDIKYKNFHRVFNVDFDNGGRFYNHLVQNIPSSLRKFIKINGNPTVEIDYSGFHLRLLYHLEEIDFKDDPYEKLIGNSIKIDSTDTSNWLITPNPDDYKRLITNNKVVSPLTIRIPYIGFSGLDERTKYKIAQIILVNATDTINKKGKIIDAMEVAVKGIKNGLLEEGYNIGHNDILDIINKFKKHHKPINKYLFSGKSGMLQKIDSSIMNDILVHFTKQGIPALSIHDSVIVEKRYKDELVEMMEFYYKKRTGFNPVIH